MTNDVQTRFHNVLSRPVWSHGSGKWTLRAEDRKRIEAAKMRQVDKVKRNKHKISTIRKKLKTKKMKEEIKNYHKNWYFMWTELL